MDPKLASIVLAEDENGLRYNIPNVRYKKWQINSLGFRGEEIDPNKKESQTRVVCLGGSETFGVYETQNMDWPSQLGAMLKEHFQGVEVINASVAGQSLKKKREYVEKYILPLKPDILILFQGSILYINDRIRGEKKKKLGNKAKEKKSKDSIKPLIVHNEVFLKPGKIIEQWLPKWLLHRFHRWRLHRKIRIKESQYLAGKKPMDEIPDGIVKEYAKDIREFVRYLKGKDILPVLSTYPTPFTLSNKAIFKDSLMSIRRLCVELSEDGIIAADKTFNGVFRKIADEENVLLIDNDRFIPKNPDYFVNYPHYTDKGAEFIAKNIFNILNHQRVIK